jgi:hypothetical protein
VRYGQNRLLPQLTFYWELRKPYRIQKGALPEAFRQENSPPRLKAHALPQKLGRCNCDQPEEVESPLPWISTAALAKLARRIHDGCLIAMELPRWHDERESFCGVCFTAGSGF